MLPKNLTILTAGKTLSESMVMIPILNLIFENVCVYMNIPNLFSTVWGSLGIPSIVMIYFSLKQ